MDCAFMTEQGLFNYRVAAIIPKDGKILMARTPQETRVFYYSVGGRVHFGESLTEAVLREVREETGADCEIDRLACIHENFFVDDSGVPFHEVSAFFVIRPNDDLLRVENGRVTDQTDAGEYLEWIDPHRCEDTIYPEFFRTIDFETDREFRHIVTYE